MDNLIDEQRFGKNKFRELWLVIRNHNRVLTMVEKYKKKVNIIKPFDNYKYCISFVIPEMSFLTFRGKNLKTY